MSESPSEAGENQRRQGPAVLAAPACLTPAYRLARCSAAFASTSPPAELAALLGALNAGYGFDLYLRLQQTTANTLVSFGSTDDLYLVRYESVHVALTGQKC